MVACLLSPFFVSCDKNEIDGPIHEDELIERKDITLTRTEQEMVANNNAFAFNLFTNVKDKLSEGKSFMVSPLSVTYAFGMLNNGADGITKEEICKVLGIKDAESMNAFCRKMIDESGKLDPSTKLSIANAIEVNQNYKLYDDFIKVVKENYDAQVENLDFSSQNSLKHINDWCAYHTNDLIPTIINELDKDAISVLMNAIYFKGIWTNKFDKKDTKKKTFTLENGKEIMVEMMQQKDQFSLGGNDACQALSLPYGNMAYSLTILLPNKGKNIQDVLKSIDRKNWRKSLNMYGQTVEVKIPSFKTESKFNLEDILPSMGMPSAFSNKADFSKFCTKPASISKVVQKSYIEVNEEGTEAAAVTIIEMVNAGSPTSIPQIPVFNADHPFVYIISEVSTNTIFFIGEYNGVN